MGACEHAQEADDMGAVRAFPCGTILCSCLLGTGLCSRSPERQRLRADQQSWPGNGSMSLFGDHIPLLRPWLGEEEAEAARQVILSGWISQGPIVAEFESAVADLVGCAHAVATNAATSALHLALLV